MVQAIRFLGGVLSGSKLREVTSNKSFWIGPSVLQWELKTRSQLMRVIYYMTIKTVILTVRDTWTSKSKYNCTFGRNRTRGNRTRGKHPTDASQYRPQNMPRLLQPRPHLQAKQATKNSAKPSWRDQNLSLGHFFSPEGWLCVIHSKTIITKHLCA